MYMTNLVVTILAGGNGTRMRSEYPKVLHSFEGKPMLTRIVETAYKLNPKRIIIVTGKHHDKIVNTINTQVKDKEKEKEKETEIIYVQQPIAQGTGDAIKCCLKEYAKEDKVLILNGDTPKLTHTILETFITHAKGSCNILCAKLENPKGYGRIYQNETGEVEGIIEEKDCSAIQKQIQIVNTGIYYMDTTILQKYIPLITNNNKKEEFYLTDVVKIVKNNSWNVIHAVKLNESSNKYIMGVNSPEELVDLTQR